MTLQELHSAVAKKKFEPMYFFHGAEDFLIDEGVRLIVDHALDPSMRSFNLDVLYGGKTDAREVVAHASAFPMMSDRRIVVVREFEKLVVSESSKEILSAYIQRPLESTVFVMVALQADLRRKPFTDLRKRAATIECKPLWDNQVHGWIADRIRQMGKTANPEACRLLQAYAGNSLRVLQSELEKLFTYVSDRKTITPEDIAAVVGASKGYTVFDLQNAIGAKDMRTATRILERMLQGGQSPQMIIVMLTRFFTQLWKLHELRRRKAPESEIAGQLGVNPYYVKEYLSFQQRFTESEVELAFRALLEADTVLKTTSRDAKIVLDLVLHSFIRGKRKEEPVEA
jgi:DNA polymerase-3 subunit delta